ALKSQVAVDEGGRVVNVGESRPGRWADLKVFRRSGLAGELIRAKVGALGDLGYVGLGGLSPRLAGATPRRKPRGRGGPAEGRRRGGQGGGRQGGGGEGTGRGAGGPPPAASTIRRGCGQSRGWSTGCPIMAPPTEQHRRAGRDRLSLIVKKV